MNVFCVVFYSKTKHLMAIELSIALNIFKNLYRSKIKSNITTIALTYIYQKIIYSDVMAIITKKCHPVFIIVT